MVPYWKFKADTFPSAWNQQCWELAPGYGAQRKGRVPFPEFSKGKCWWVGFGLATCSWKITERKLQKETWLKTNFSRHEICLLSWGFTTEKVLPFSPSFSTPLRWLLPGSTALEWWERGCPLGKRRVESVAFWENSPERLRELLNYFEQKKSVSWMQEPKMIGHYPTWGQKGPDSCPCSRKWENKY